MDCVHTRGYICRSLPLVRKYDREGPLHRERAEVRLPEMSASPGLISEKRKKVQVKSENS